jgi:aryl-alcohol dehydrogenase-like predicted oxidoreductase
LKQVATATTTHASAHGAAQANQPIADAVRSIADARGAAAAQIALAWVSAQSARLGVPVVPIPGTKRVKWLRQNAQATDITLTDDELAVLDALAAQVVGARYWPPRSTSHPTAAAGPRLSCSHRPGR